VTTITTPLPAIRESLAPPPAAPPIQQKARKTRTIAWKKVWWVPLAVILVAQAILSGRLAASSVSLDEGRYIYAGHQLIYELLHGGGSPYYETYFSGVPVIYCPLAAIADHFGGIVAVRLMSLTFSLMTTVLLFIVTKRLFGYWAGVAAAALFSALGLTFFVGTYANYDALAMLFMAFATYCAVRSLEARWLLLLPLILLAANMTKYATVLFDPVVICLAALQVGSSGKRYILRRTVILGATTMALVGFTTYLAGSAYLKGMLFSTFARSTGANKLLGASYKTTPEVVVESWQWIGVVVALGVVALLVALGRRDRKRLALLGLVVLAGLLVTLEGIHLHSDESMNQHDDFSAWFACISAGYALAVIPRLAPVRIGRTALACAAACLIVFTGMHYASQGRTFSLGSEGGIDLVGYAKIKPYLQLHGARYLISGQSGFQTLYVEHADIPWFDFVDDYYIKYPIPGRGGDSHGQVRGHACHHLLPHCVYLMGTNGYQAAIRAHYFAFITITGIRFATDKAILQAVAHTPGYVHLANLNIHHVSYVGSVWVYAPAYRHMLTAHSPVHPTVSSGFAFTRSWKYGTLTFLPSLIFLALGLGLVFGVRACQADTRKS
jgi:Dolichyl-phosphate-mannose-protein mannosyltransferase